MKKFTFILFIFSFIFFTFNTSPNFSAPYSSIISEGFYSLPNLNLLENIEYFVQNTSPNYESFIIIFDNQGRIKQSVRLAPNSPKYTLLPLKNNYKIIVIGNGNLVFS